MHRWVYLGICLTLMTAFMVGFGMTVRPVTDGFAAWLTTLTSPAAGFAILMLGAISLGIWAYRANSN